MGPPGSVGSHSILRVLGLLTLCVILTESHKYWPGLDSPYHVGSAVCVCVCGCVCVCVRCNLLSGFIKRSVRACAPNHESRGQTDDSKTSYANVSSHGNEQATVIGVINN